MSTAATAASPLSPQHPRSATSLSRPSSRTATTRARTPSVTYNNTSGGTADRDSGDPGMPHTLSSSAPAGLSALSSSSRAFSPPPPPIENISNDVPARTSRRKSVSSRLAGFALNPFRRKSNAGPPPSAFTIVSGRATPEPGGGGMSRASSEAPSSRPGSSLSFHTAEDSHASEPPPPMPSLASTISLPATITGSSARAPARSVSPLPSTSASSSTISAIKHSMRQQHAQVSKLENELLQGPWPIPGGPLEPTPSLSASTSSNPSHNRSGSGGSVNGGASRPPVLNRRSSRDVLEELAGPDSSLPLPMSNIRFASSASSLHSNIQEGVPMEFKNGSTASLPSKRTPSPTRTLSRIPVSSVGNARALADEGSSPLPALDVFGSSSANTSLTLPPPSPSGSYTPSGTSTANKRLTLTPGGTTKVLADLQTGVANARNALENTKQQLRLSQRQVASLTRQTEDLKEGRERLRLENEGLNNVVARKERLLQEAISRARKAEEERDTLRTQLKTETSSSKKALRDTETALSEATALSQRRDREYVTLRDSLRGLTDGFKSDHATLREEMRRREERVRKEADEMGKKYRALLEETRAAEEARAEVRRAGKDKEENAGRIREAWKEEIDAMKEEVARSSKESEEAVQLANSLSLELTRLRRLMQAAGRETSDPGPTN